MDLDGARKCLTSVEDQLVRIQHVLNNLNGKVTDDDDIQVNNLKRSFQMIQLQLDSLELEFANFPDEKNIDEADIKKEIIEKNKRIVVLNSLLDSLISEKKCKKNENKDELHKEMPDSGKALSWLEFVKKGDNIMQENENITENIVSVANKSEQSVRNVAEKMDIQTETLNRVLNEYQNIIKVSSETEQRLSNMIKNAMSDRYLRVQFITLIVGIVFLVIMHNAK